MECMYAWRRGLLVAGIAAWSLVGCAVSPPRQPTAAAPLDSRCERPDREASVDAASMAAHPARFPDGDMPEHVERVVPLVVDVDPSGAVSNVSIQVSSRSRAVDRAAMAAAREWRYVPAESACRAVWGRVQVQVDFGPPR